MSVTEPWNEQETVREIIKSMPLVMPPEIAKAVIAVMSEVKKLGKEGTNTFARYRFTSVDQFYEALGPLMASHGLMVMAHEISTDISIREVADDKGQVKKSAWLTAVYDFWLFHESGVSYGPIKRTQQAQATGPQSYASAQSFATKYFLRNILLVPTGDVDEIEQAQQVGLPEPERINTEQFERLQKGIKVTKTDEREFCRLYHVEGLSDLTAAQYQNAINFLKQKMTRMKADQTERTDRLAEVDAAMKAANIP